MKQLIYFTLVFYCLGINKLQSQKTYMPDDAFEIYIESAYPPASDGIPLNDSVNTNGLSVIGALNINPSLVEITDFTGIEDMINVGSFIIEGQLADTIDLSVINSQITLISEIFILNNSNLKYFKYPQVGFYNSTIENNPQLETIETTATYSGNLIIRDNALLDSLDLSYFFQLLQIEIDNNPILNFCNIKMGNPNIINDVTINGNDSLNCITVDDPGFSSANWSWTEHSINPVEYQYVDSLGKCGLVKIMEENITDPSPVKAYDMLGRPVDLNKTNEIIFVLYSDGTIRREFRMNK